MSASSRRQRLGGRPAGARTSTGRRSRPALRIPIRISNSGKRQARGKAGHSCVFPRQDIVRVMHLAGPSRKRRAQGMPGAGRTHGPPATKKAGGRYHRQGRSNPAFPARWCYGLLRALPGVPGFVATVASSETGFASGLIPASGDQDHAPSPSVKLLSSARTHALHSLTATASRLQRP